MSAAASLALLAAAIVIIVARPFRLPRWVAPFVFAAIAFMTGLVSWSQIRVEAQTLNPAILFLLAAVPLAVLLDRLGFFEALAELVGGGRSLERNLWIVAAIITTVLNLDASVVLLTPLYVRIARRRGLDPTTLAFQPVILAMLASSTLPVSNLTNLIASNKLHLSMGTFFVHLALPTLVATTVGWFCYRRAFHIQTPTVHAPSHPNRRPLVIGSITVLVVLVGFTVGPSFGIAPWTTALVIDIVLIVVTRSVPWRALPLNAGVVVGGLAVLAAGAAPHLPIAQLLGPQHSAFAAVRGVGVGTLGALLMNNVPALLVTLPSLSAHGQSLWGVLLGLNIGPALLVTGSLACLLWLESVRHLGIHVSARTYTRIGLRVGLPALVASTVTLFAFVH
jgi:arsenical pump membrane protein